MTVSPSEKDEIKANSVLILTSVNPNVGDGVIRIPCEYVPEPKDYNINDKH